MRIRFLGTSAGWPLPRLGCTCEICTSPDPKDTRLRSSLLVNESILIDAGPDTYQKLQTIDPTKIKQVILTHWHPDHTLGVWDLGHIYNSSKVTLYGTNPTFERMKLHIGLEKINIQEITFNQKIELSDVTFTNYEVIHTEGTIAVSLTHEEKTLLYIPDFKTIPPASIEKINPPELLIMDGSSKTKDTETLTHQSIETGIQLAKKLQAKQVGFTHLGHESGRHQDLEKYVTVHGGKNFFIPYDTMEVTL